jgi:hypothetical protein
VNDVPADPILNKVGSSEISSDEEEFYERTLIYQGGFLPMNITNKWPTQSSRITRSQTRRFRVNMCH